MDRKTKIETAVFRFGSKASVTKSLAALLLSGSLLSGSAASTDVARASEARVAQAMTTRPVETGIESVVVPVLPLETVQVPSERDVIARLLPQNGLEEIVPPDGVILPNQITVSRPGLDCAAIFMIFQASDQINNISVGTIAPRAAIVDPAALATDGMENSQVHHAESLLAMGIDHPRADSPTQLIEEIAQIDNNLAQVCG